MGCGECSGGFRWGAELRSACPGLRPGSTQTGVSCGVGWESRFLDSGEVRARSEWQNFISWASRLFPSGRLLLAERNLGAAGEVFADAVDGVALAFVQGEEFETVAQALAVADDGANFDGIG